MPRLQIDRKLLRAPQSALNGNPPLGKKKKSRRAANPSPSTPIKNTKHTWKRARSHTAYTSKTNMEKQNNNMYKNNRTSSKNRTRRNTIQPPKAISNAGTIKTLPQQ